MSHFKTALEIVQNADDQIPMLVENMLPKVGLAALGGDSDLGKSTFLRQLCLSVVLGHETFMGRSLHAEYRRALYITTEDSLDNIGPSLKLQLRSASEDLSQEELSNLFFQEEASYQKIQESLDELEDRPVDVIVIDCFSDIVGGDMNASHQVRKVLNKLNTISKQMNCLVLVLHHLRKSANTNSAGKSDLLGSSGFEAKMRAILMLHSGSSQDSRRLRIPKANYLPPEQKETAINLSFRELYFQIVGENEVSTQSQGDSNRKEAEEIVERLRQKLANGDHQVKSLFQEAVESGYPYGKSKFYAQMKEPE